MRSNARSDVGFGSNPDLTPIVTGCPLSDSPYRSGSHAINGSSLRITPTAVVTIKTYPTPFEAASAKISLDAAGIPSVVVGVGVTMEGGMAGVQLQVAPDQVEPALAVLKGH